MFLSLEDWQEPIKRISLNTRTLIVVFNEILIPRDSNTSRFFFEDNYNSSKNPSSEIRDHIPKSFKISYFIIFFYMYLKNMKDNNNTTWHTKMMRKNKILEKE